MACFWATRSYFLRSRRRFTAMVDAAATMCCCQTWCCACDPVKVLSLQYAGVVRFASLCAAFVLLLVLERRAKPHAMVVGRLPQWQHQTYKEKHNALVSSKVLFVERVVNVWVVGT